MTMLRKVILLIYLVVLLFLFKPLATFALNDCPTSCSNSSDCQKRVDCLAGNVNELHGQANTLSSQIAVMDNQINLTQARIDSTKQQISDLTLDIDTANKKITNLQSSLDDLVKVLLNRVVITYEVGQIQPLQILATSGNANNFFTRLNYLKIAQAHDKQLIYLTQQAKNDYQNQKNIYEDKKKKILTLKAQLESYTAQLEQNKVDKQQLLSETRGSQATYQDLLSQAQTQLASFQSFVQSQGGVTLIDADPNWPSNYLSQRDKRWGAINIAGYYSSPNYVTTIGESGCLISSVAMVLSKKGNSNTPLGIGTTGSYFFNAYFLWSALNSLGFNTPTRTTDTSIIDNALSQGKWPIIGMTHTSCTSCDPFHFVVVTGKNGSDYNLFDPWKGPNVSFNSNYGSDYITEIITY